MSNTEQDIQLKYFLPALFAAATMFAAQPGHAEYPPKGVCFKQGLSATCSDADASKSQRQEAKQDKTVKTDSKNIDPIITCGVDKKAPCAPKKPSK
ncbi:hypothetical protein H4S14_004182 [Agrobacterium vitis]|nr:hypothetical protein [Agrobacterium vitis]MBE1440408.1 hypothetical protein [Agrobacterium vitis]